MTDVQPAPPKPPPPPDDTDRHKALTARVREVNRWSESWPR
ncbi:hypothetical protein [Streptomyces chrestomyceticus]